MTTACWNLDERLDVGEDESIEFGSDWIPIIRGRDLDIFRWGSERPEINGLKKEINDSAIAKKL